MGPSDRRTAPVPLVLASVTSVQFGAALAATLFPLVGPVAVVALRSITAAAALAVARPVARPGAGRVPGGWRVPVALGVVLAGMNTCVYEAVDRLPLGIVITLEFLGPLGVALAGSRRPRDVLFALAAAAGVVLLTVRPGGGPDGAGPAGGTDLAGVALALAGAAGWAAYILLNRELGRAGGGGQAGLLVASVVAAALVTPAAVLGAAATLLSPRVLGVGLAVGLLSSALPFTLDRIALRRLPAAAFGVLMSLNPAMATLAGLLVLHQQPASAQLAGTALVVVASAGAAAVGARP